MRTSLRGLGGYKKDLLDVLVTRFGERPFSFKQIKRLRVFEYRAFYKLAADGYFKHVQTRNGSRWQVGNAVYRTYTKCGKEGW